MSENLTEYQRGGSSAWKGHWEPSRAAGFRLGEVGSRNQFAWRGLQHGHTFVQPLPSASGLCVAWVFCGCF